MDLYVYADGDPVNYFDPDGRLKSAINAPLPAKFIRPYEAFGNNRNSKWDALGGSLLGAVKFSSNWLQGLGESYGALAKADFLEDIPVHQRRLIQEAEQDLWRKNEQAAARYIVNNINFDPSSSIARQYETGTYQSLVVVDILRPKLKMPAGLKGFKSFTQRNFRANLQILTKNSIDASMEAHHVLPQKYKDIFLAKGINIHEPRLGTWWEKINHRENAKTYNLAWENFIRYENPNATTSEILEKGRQLMLEYGMHVNY
jgi:hypothetical protein